MLHATVLGCVRFRSRPKKKDAFFRTARHYEIDLSLNDERECILNGEVYPLKAGSVTVCRPGDTIGSRGGLADKYCLTVTFSEEGIVPPQPMYYTRMRDVRPIRQSEPPELIAALPRVFTVQHRELAAELFESLLQLGSEREADGEAMSRACEKLLLFLASEAIEEPRLRPSQSPVAARVQLYLRKHYDEELSIAELAGQFGFSQGYLISCFRREYGCAPSQYLLRLRMENARSLLMLSDASVSEIAVRCGYRSPSFFSTMFRKYYGASPREFRNGEENRSSEEKQKEIRNH